MVRQGIVLITFAVAAGCAPRAAQHGNDAPGEDEGPRKTGGFVLVNHGGTAMEGHTPRGFRGKGTGLFIGDNINAKFPEGDGTQVFLSFALEPATGGEVERAILSSRHFHAKGSPFADLGVLQLQEMVFDAFSADLWNQKPAPGGVDCAFASSIEGPFECDVTDAVRRALAQGRTFVQFRLRFERAGDSDGSADMALFYVNDLNVNEPGCFEINGVLR